MNLTKLAESLFEGKNAEILKTIQNSTGVTSDQLGDLVSKFIPKVTEAIQANLLNGSLIPNLMSLASKVDLSNLTENPSQILDDKNKNIGKELLNLIFGGEEKVTQLNSNLSSNSSINESSLSSLLPTLATAVIGMVMSNQGGGLQSLITSMFGQNNEDGTSSNSLMDMAKNFLDKDGDGAIMDDIFATLTKK